MRPKLDEELVAQPVACQQDARLVVRLVTARLNRVHAAESLSGVKIGEIEPGGEEDWSKSNETYCAHIIMYIYRLTVCKSV